MSDTASKIKNKYFAAANSYDGFISYFDSIFDSREYSRLFILKGGPGTGKNSFMRGVRDRFNFEEFEIEEIYCSSDPSSLDGVIIKCGEKKIAIIDGTAPHERDAKIPGAIDQIVNLGQNWDSAWLSAEREKILTLNEEKRKAYSTAYEYLKIGKGAFEFIKETHKKLFDYRSAERQAKSLLKNTKKSDKYKENIRLISAFGKEGLITLDTIDKISECHLKIGGDPIFGMLFIGVVRDTAREEEISQQVSPYPLSNDLYEGIYLQDGIMGITLSESSAHADLDANTFAKKLTDLDAERIKKAGAILRESEDEAIRWFKIASDLHFRLEDIYSRAMSFDENNKLLSKITEEIEIIFDKSK